MKWRGSSWKEQNVIGELGGGHFDDGKPINRVIAVDHREPVL